MKDIKRHSVEHSYFLYVVLDSGMIRDIRLKIYLKCKPCFKSSHINFSKLLPSKTFIRLFHNERIISFEECLIKQGKNLRRMYWLFTFIITCSWNQFNVSIKKAKLSSDRLFAKTLKRGGNYRRLRINIGIEYLFSIKINLDGVRMNKNKLIRKKSIL